MVRNMVGTLIEVGRGHWQPDRVLAVLESKDRGNAGQTAPPNGLCMQWVKYVPGVWRPHTKERGDEFVDEPENGDGRGGDEESETRSNNGEECSG
jgi:tRNA pseudouridine38-40 synthase